MTEQREPASVALVLNQNFRMRLSAHGAHPATGQPAHVGLEAWIGEGYGVGQEMAYAVQRLGSDRAREIGSHLIRLADLTDGLEDD